MNTNLFAALEPAQPASAGWYTAHCDGGSRGNPGPSGFGAVVEDPQGRVVARLSEFLGRQTNNYAEYQGLLAVLGWALQNGVRQLRVVSDSELMVNQMKGRYKVASPTLRPLWEEARRRASALERFEMRHTLRGGNQEADQLANEAMDRGMKNPAARTATRPAASPATTPAPSPAHRHEQSIASRAYTRKLDGIVRNGVVHLLDGSLPDGTLVTVSAKLTR